MCDPPVQLAPCRDSSWMVQQCFIKRTDLTFSPHIFFSQMYMICYKTFSVSILKIYFTSHIVPPRLLCRFPVAWFPACVEGELNISCRFLNWECRPSHPQTDYFSLFTGSLLIFRRTEMACSSVFPGRLVPPVMSLSGKHNSLWENARVSKWEQSKGGPLICFCGI